ncbi:MAG: (E)-4-hydroxy-3-methylbut-2-enyl-diphosphate synthase [Bacteroidales bacterium]|nr:(E)-4-hydroxy-3-methylbut-2-enyl-diphosphate synthase [Bacteroidales bacterium]
MNKTKIYASSLTDYQRWVTREVRIGNLKLGGNNPIRLQSMSSVDPMDTANNVAQAIRIIEAGGELVRFTAPAMRDAKNLENISTGIRDAGYDTPLVADIHFNPKAAMVSAEYVEKIRINPGNFAEPKGGKINYSKEEYTEALVQIEGVFAQLVDFCKTKNRAMRIGSNHGSLSQRIMDRYGDTPEGMVEAAMEYLRMAVRMDYLDIVLSMKASNIRVMVQAYRLLVYKMRNEGMNFPIHLGVTEAGEGEDGRIKSAAGIGALLEDGIGDTIRVSLTEEPEFEIPVAKIIANRYSNRKQNHGIKAIDHNPLHPFEYNKRVSRDVVGIGGKNVPMVMEYDYYFDNTSTDKLKIIAAKDWKNDQQAYPLFNFNDFAKAKNISTQANFISMSIADFEGDWQSILSKSKNNVLVFEAHSTHSMAEHRRMFIELINNNIDLPVIIKKSYIGLSEEEFQIYAAADLGALFVDGLGDGLWIEHDEHIPRQRMIDTALGVLQAARSRITKTDYISCPSCGRTLYNIQETTARIREKTEHLVGLKIGIMGCIVNGPGEMADADYGYVGAGFNKINLYKGKEVMHKGIPEENAVERLIDLIREHGDWVDSNNPI